MASFFFALGRLEVFRSGSEEWRGDGVIWQEKKNSLKISNIPMRRRQEINFVKLFTSIFFH